jgi:ActR/RegA family two-component response regulator
MSTYNFRSIFLSRSQREYLHKAYYESTTNSEAAIDLNMHRICLPSFSEMIDKI